jgi:hypothetical protein
MTPEEIQREIETFCNRMSEHVDSIRVIVTKPQDGMTAYHSYGEGNWYAQIASAQRFLSMSENEDLANLINEAISEE